MKFKIQASLFNLLYIKWSNIKYDRDKCIDFINEYNNIKDKNAKIVYEKIIQDIGSQHITKLLEGDYETCRLAEIEKWSRNAVAELLTIGQYTTDTFKIISNFPIDDYMLILKRTKELYDIYVNLKIESETKESKIPGM